MLLSSAASAIIAAAVGLASYANALAPDDPASFAFNLSPVDDLGAQPSDECFYDVTIPDLLDIGFKQYAWVPWSQLSNESLAIAPHGAFVYKTVNGTLDYQKITNVDVLSNGADLVFGEATPFMSPAQTFEDVTSGNVTIDDTVMLDRIKTGLNCSASPVSYESTAEPFVNYKRFAWVSADANKCGEFVYELKDGGLVQHSCDGPDTNAQQVDESEEVAVEDEQVDDNESESDATADVEDGEDEVPNEDTNAQTSTGNVLNFAALSTALAMASCIHFY